MYICVYIFRYIFIYLNTYIYKNLREKLYLHEFKGTGLYKFSKILECFSLVGNVIVTVFCFIYIF